MISTTLPIAPRNILHVAGGFWMYWDFGSRLHGGRALSVEHAIENAKRYGYLGKAISIGRGGE